jgi:virginiamycin B lyase
MAVVMTATTLLTMIQSIGTANATTGIITHFPIKTAGGAPDGITVGPDGNLWFTEFTANKIGRITPAGVVTEFPVTPTVDSAPVGITRGPDGNLWFTEFNGNNIGRITPAGVVTEFPVTPTVDSGPVGITTGPDGALWFTELYGNNIGRITTAGAVSEFSVSTTATGPDLIAKGPDGNLWFTEGAGNNIGKITTAGAVTEYPLPSIFSVPAGITTGPDGNLWFAEAEGNQIGKITTAGAITEFPITATFNSFPDVITKGPDDNLWFTEGLGNNIGRITTAGAITEFPITGTVNSGPVGITAGPDGNIWFAEFYYHHIGRLTLDSTPKLTTKASGGVELGETIHDTATLSGVDEVQAVGDVITFNLFGPGDTTCAKSIFTSVVPTHGNGNYDSQSFTPTEPGTYRWMAVYSGVAETTVATACNDLKESVVVAKADPDIETHASSGVSLGGAVHDTAILTDGFHPEGSITFKLFGPNDKACEHAVFSTTTEVDGNNSYQSASFTPKDAGTYRWAARYSGDDNNISAISECTDAHEAVVVAKAEPRIRTSASDPVEVGGSVKDLATLTNGANPGGTITFKLYGPDDATCSSAIFSSKATVDGNGSYHSEAFTATKAGTYRWVASYSGDGNNDGAAGVCNDPNESAVVTAQPFADAHPTGPVTVAGETTKNDTPGTTQVAAETTTTPAMSTTDGALAPKDTTKATSQSAPTSGPTPGSVAPDTTKTTPSPAATVDAAGPILPAYASSSKSHEHFPTGLVLIVLVLAAVGAYLISKQMGRSKDA